MELQYVKYDEGTKIQKRKLYKIDTTNDSISIDTVEKHSDDKYCECLQSKINIYYDQNIETFFGHEYKPEGIKSSNSKNTDIVIGFCSKLEKKIKYHSIDLKRNLITFSALDTPVYNLKITYQTISHLIEQWTDNLIYANMQKCIYRAKYLDFRPIVATRYYKEENLESLLLLNEKTDRNIELPGIVDKKRKLKENEIKQKLKVLRDFIEKRAELDGQYFSLEIIVLDKQEENKRYFKCYDFKYY